MTAYVIATEKAAESLKITEVIKATFDICEAKGTDITVQTPNGPCQIFLSKMYADKAFESVKNICQHFNDENLRKNMYQFDFKIEVDTNLIEECQK